MAERSDSVENSASGPMNGNLVQVGSADQVNLRIGNPFPFGVPWQCPVAPAVFVNRIEEIDRIRRHSKRLVVFSGGPGVGKSVLGYRVAAEVSELCPDGQLFADLRKHGRRVHVTEVVQGFLEALGVAKEWMPTGPGDQESMLRTLLRDKRMLILLDHVSTAAQILSWLPDAPGVVVAVVSQYELAELDQHAPLRVRVEPLSVEAGLALLATYCGEARFADDPELARELVTRCSGLPVVLMVVAGRLCQRPALALARVVAELPSALDWSQRRNDLEPVVRAAFDGAYYDMPDEVAHLYRLLGLHPGLELSVDTAQALLGTRSGSAERLLEILVGANLVEWAGTDRVRIGPFVAAHAAGKAQVDLGTVERYDALFRMVRYYREHAAGADLAYMGNRLRLAEPDGRIIRIAEGFASRAEALDWLDRERGNLCDVIDLAADHGWSNEVWQLCEAMWPLFLNLKHYRDWVATHGRGVVAAIDDPAAEARMRSQLARAFIELRRFDEAEPELSAAMAAAELSRDRRVQASVLEFTGRLYLERGAYDRAVEHYQRSLELHLELNRVRGAALQRHFLGQALRLSGDLEAAQSYLEQALASMETLNDTRNVGRITMSLAMLYRDLKRDDRARELLNRALVLLREVKSSFFVAQVLEQLAELEDDRACEHLVEALKIYERVGSPLAQRTRERIADYSV